MDAIIKEYADYLKNSCSESEKEELINYLNENFCEKEEKEVIDKKLKLRSDDYFNMSDEEKCLYHNNRRECSLYVYLEGHCIREKQIENEYINDEHDFDDR